MKNKIFTTCPPYTYYGRREL